MPLARTLGIKRIVGFQEHILSRYIGAAEREALNAVQIAIRQAFRSIAAKESPVFKVLIIGKGTPRIWKVVIVATEVKTNIEEFGILAQGSTIHEEPRRIDGAVGIGNTRIDILFTLGVTVEITSQLGAVYSEIKGNRGEGV